MYSPEFRKAAVQIVQKTGNVAATARRFGIARNTLIGWIKADKPWWLRRPADPEPEDLFGIYDKEDERP